RNIDLINNKIIEFSKIHGAEHCSFCFLKIVVLMTIL
ncbi:MAG: hypothetical protein ACI9A7_001275, partial [Cyclobacteriaceae bacterium]